jgi:Rrf2 family transcriptional regulator, nitric oxide-sensitive transcriptional repressor
MPQVFKMSGATALAIHALALLSSSPRGRKTREMARELGLPVYHLAKVLIRLADLGYLEGIRGPQGGYRLAGDPEKIRLLEIYEAMEGRLKAHDCLFNKPVCPRKKCVMDDLMEKINKEVAGYLASTRLSDLAENTGKD